MLWLEDGTFRELATMATDPVCGMTVSQHDQPRLQRDGTVWWFCSIACSDEFAADPARFGDRPLARDASAATRPRP